MRLEHFQMSSKAIAALSAIALLASVFWTFPRAPKTPSAQVEKLLNISREIRGNAVSIMEGDHEPKVFLQCIDMALAEEIEILKRQLQE